MILGYIDYKSFIWFCRGFWINFAIDVVWCHFVWGSKCYLSWWRSPSWQLFVICRLFILYHIVFLLHHRLDGCLLILIPFRDIVAIAGFRGDCSVAVFLTLCQHVIVLDHQGLEPSRLFTVIVSPISNRRGHTITRWRRCIVWRRHAMSGWGMVRIPLVMI